MKRLSAFAAMLLAAVAMMAETKTLPSVGNKTELTISDDGGLATYSVTYEGVQVMTPSRLGFEANFADFTKGLKMGDIKTQFRDMNVKTPEGKNTKINAVR
jgi:hypothetical protein